jgi:hypothetical protein
VLDLLFLLTMLSFSALAIAAAAAGMSLGNLAKVLKCAGNDDIVVMKAADDGDAVTFMFESPSECACAGWMYTCCVLQAVGMVAAAGLTCSVG